MGSSSAEPSNKGIDASVGGLVWVRRRNGSWWPGRIVGLDELSEGCLVSPRSGTPVKLLGREDASIDWYNLEKSKRVKAFRCGEYDACIEKAKAAAASSSKKAVKYARREDAILHALEIESARLDKDHPDFFSRMDNSVFKPGNLAAESPAASHSGKETDDISHDASDFDGDSLSAPEVSYSGTSFEEPSHASPSKLQPEQGTRRRTPNDSEDDGMEGTKRMRGLEDLGMGVASDKKVGELIQQDNAPLNCSNTANCMSNGGSMNGGKGSASLKRKRSQVAHVHDFMKRRNRRRPLTKVLESTMMVSVPVTCEQFASSCASPFRGASEGKISGVMTNNSESTGLSYENGAAAVSIAGHVSNNGHVADKTKKEASSLLGPLESELSEKLFDVPFVAEDTNSAGFPSVYTTGSFGRTQVGVLGRDSSQMSQPEALQSEGINEYGYPNSAVARVGNISQRMEKTTSKWQSKGKRNSRHLSKKRRRLYGQRENCNDAEGSLFDLQNHAFKSKPASGSEGQVNGMCDHHSKQTPPHKVSPMRRTAELKSLTDGPLSSTPQSQRSLPYRQSRFTLHPRYQTAEYPVGDLHSNSTLYDIKLEVNASYKPSDVPLVSLMSKLNGKAIVGHPLTVEALDDDCSNDLGNSEMGRGLERNPEFTRIPRKPLASRSRSRSRSSKAKYAKSKKCGLMSKKMRKLSSLTGQRKGEDIGKPLVEKPRSAVISCIPVKLVFSRINEAVNGSLRLSHRAATSTHG